MDRVITLLIGFVAGPARAYVDAERLRRTATESDEEWWERNAPVLEQIMDPSRYPVSGRVGQAAGEEYGAAADPDAPSSSGSRRVIDGIEAYVAAAPRAERRALRRYCAGGRMSAPAARPTRTRGEPEPEARPEAHADPDECADDECRR